MLAVQLLQNVTNKKSAATVTKRLKIAEQNIVAKAQRKLSAQQKSDPISVTTSSSNKSDALEINPITDVRDPSSNITESLSNIHRFTAIPEGFDCLTLKPSTPAYTAETGTFTHMRKPSLPVTF